MISSITWLSYQTHDGGAIFKGVAFTRGPRPVESSSFTLRRNGRFEKNGEAPNSSLPNNGSLMPSVQNRNPKSILALTAETQAPAFARCTGGRGKPRACGRGHGADENGLFVPDAFGRASQPTSN